MNNIKTLLAIETVSEHCSVALTVAGEIYSLSVAAPMNHSQVILSLVEQVLRKAEISLDACEAIVVDHGPGSFTGVRIGVMVANGLAYAKNIPIKGVDSLLALTRSAPEGVICSVLDARMNELYCGVYRNNGSDAEQLLAPSVIAVEQFADVIEQLQDDDIAHQGEPIYCIGNGLKIVPENEKEKLDHLLEYIDKDSPDAVDLLHVAGLFPANAFVDATHISMRYVRNQVAKKMN